MIELEVQLAKNNYQIEVDLSSSVLYAISPTAKIELIQNGNYLITITDKNGTTLAEIPVVNRDTVNTLLTQYFNEDPIIQEYIQNFLSNLTFDLSDRMAKGIGSGSIVEGAIAYNTADGNCAHSSGADTHADGNFSYAQGDTTTANRALQHVFGRANVIEEGAHNTEGTYIEIVGNGVNAANRSNARTLDWSGNETLAGKLTIGIAPTNNMDVATKQYVDNHADNFDLNDRMAKGKYYPVPDVELDGTGNLVIGNIERNKSISSYAIAEGDEVTASGWGSHAEGCGTWAKDSGAHAEGSSELIYLRLTGAANATTYTAEDRHSQHLKTRIYTERNTVEVLYNHEVYGITNIVFDGSGNLTSITFDKSLNPSTAWNSKSISFALITVAGSKASHAEGVGTKAVGGHGSHSEGLETCAIGIANHSEGVWTMALGYGAHAEGIGTRANHASQHVFGEYNIPDDSSASHTVRGNYIEIVGNGEEFNESNARTLDWSGNEKLAGSLTLGMGTQDEVTITAAQLKQLLQLL